MDQRLIDTSTVSWAGNTLMLQASSTPPFLRAALASVNMGSDTT